MACRGVHFALTPDEAEKIASAHDDEGLMAAVEEIEDRWDRDWLGRSRKRPIRKDWESVKDRIMHEAVLAKFSQHADPREVLLGTGDAVIVEHTQNDAYWGGGGDGRGKNRLGQILMRVREELRRSEPRS